MALVILLDDSSMGGMGLVHPSLPYLTLKWLSISSAHGLLLDWLEGLWVGGMVLWFLPSDMILVSVDW